MFLVHHFNDIHYFCKNKVCIEFLLLFFVLFLFIRSMLILIVFKVTHSLYFRRCMIKKCMHVMPSFHVRDSCCFSQMYVGYMEKVQVPLRETNAIYLVLAMISTCKRRFLHNKLSKLLAHLEIIPTISCACKRKIKFPCYHQVLYFAMQPTST